MVRVCIKVPRLPRFNPRTSQPSIPEEEPQSPPPGQVQAQSRAPPNIKRSRRNAVLARKRGKRDGDPKELFRAYWSRKKHKKFTKESRQRIVALFIHFRNKGMPTEMIEKTLSNLKLDLEIK
jgi:hypothetical protein